MDVKRRIALLVQAQGAKRASQELDGVGTSTKKVGDESKRSATKMAAARKDADSYQRKLRSVATAAKLGAVGLAALTFAVGEHSIDEFRESYKAMRQTDAAIKSTGGAARVTAKDIGDLANRISLKSGIDDEAIQSGENLLLTFTKIRNEAGQGNDVFNQASQAVTDMSVAMDQDLKGSAIQVGKALNDPVKGMTALQRVGVAFTADQKKQVAGWVKHGQTLRAQKFILRELNTEFAGSAAAQADPFDKAKVAVDNLAETLGYLAGPPLMSAATAAATFVNQMSEGTGAGGDFRRILTGVGAKLADVATQAWGVARRAIDLYHGFQQGRTGAVLLVAAVAGLTAAFVTLKVVSTIIGLIRAARTAMWLLNAAMIANPAVFIAAAIIGVGVALFIAYKKIRPFRQAVQNTWSWIKDHWPLLLSILTGPMGAAAIFFVRHFRQIKDTARDALNFIIRGWNGLHFKIPGFKVGPVKFGGTDIGVPKIPELANGGMVSGAGRWITGERGAELNESDGRGNVKVTPLEKHKPVSMAGALGDRDLLIDSPIHMDGKKVGHQMRRVALRDLLNQSPA